MLKQLVIKNIAIIESLRLDFKEGLTVITGESGSGKSILLDSIALAFGARVSPKEILRAGTARGQVELLFELGRLAQHPVLQSFLAEQGVELLPGETELLLSREFTPSSSRSRINGIPVSREVLEQLRPWVIDLHGQHELTSLFHREQQRAYLDAFGGSEASKLKDQVTNAYDRWLHAKRQLEEAQERQSQFEQQRDFMAFQLEELQQAQLNAPDEDTRIREELEILSHADKLGQIACQGAALLHEEDGPMPSLLGQLARLEKKLAEGAQLDKAMETILTRLQGASLELRELASDLTRYADRIEQDPERMATLTDRLDLLEKLKRKYGPTLAAVLEKQAELQAALDALEAGEAGLEALQAQVREQEAELARASQQLSQLRAQLACRLRERLTEQLQILALPSASFDIHIEPIPYSRDGAESVEFLFSANPGESMRPLAKVASGGELSRFLLALKALTAENDGLLTLVFDEIDTGISGPTAKAVAEKLGELSRHLQVLAITHQPMIAAMGQQHWHVEKRLFTAPTGQESVQVCVQALEGNENERLSVLSRLVSGIESSDEAVEQFVRRLREQASRFFNEEKPASTVTSVPV